MGELINLGVKQDGERIVISSRVIAHNFEKGTTTFYEILWSALVKMDTPEVFLSSSTLELLIITKLGCRILEFGPVFHFIFQRGHVTQPAV